MYISTPTLLSALLLLTGITPTLADTYELKCTHMTICADTRRSDCTCDRATGDIAIPKCPKLPNCATVGGCYCERKKCEHAPCRVMK